LNKLAIIGSGGHTRALLVLVEKHFGSGGAAIYDDSFEAGKDEHISLVPLVGKIRDIPADQKIILSMGDNAMRKGYFFQFRQQIVHESLSHDTAFREVNSIIGGGNQFYANSYVGAEVKVGDNNILNSGSIVEHESSIGSHNHISVGAKICGRSHLGSTCLVGAGAVILDKVSICDEVVIGAGSIVTSDILHPGVYIGTPAVRIK